MCESKNSLTFHSSCKFILCESLYGRFNVLYVLNKLIYIIEFKRLIYINNKFNINKTITKYNLIDYTTRIDGLLYGIMFHLFSTC